MKQLYFSLVVFLLPLLAKADGLVPCGAVVVDGNLQNVCGFCDVGKLIKNVADWFGMVSGFLVVLVIIYAGLRMVYSVGDVSAKTNAKRLIGTGVIGYILILGAWMLVDTFLKFLIPGSSYGIANPLICS